MRLSIITSGIVAALVGFGATLAIIVAAGQAIGASTEQMGSWLAAVCLSLAATTAYLSLRYRQPIITAWSTPGVALVAASGGVYDVHEAVAAFLLAGLLILLTAAISPLGRMIARIPQKVAAAMLAGVLFGFVIRVFEALPQTPVLVLPLVILFFLVRLFSPSAAVLTVLIGGIALALALGLNEPLPQDLDLSRLVLIEPHFELSALIGLGLPLYLVTMASQNLPGFAVLRTAGYEPPVQPILATTGVASLASAPFGAHTSNLAAITAALCTGPDVHPDPAKRWMTGPFYALTYIVLAAFGASLVGLFAAMPQALVVTVGGLALISPLMGALAASMAGEGDHFPAVVTFVVTASGMAIFGIGAAFWGLLAGAAIAGLTNVRQMS